MRSWRLNLGNSGPSNFFVGSGSLIRRIRWTGATSKKCGSKRRRHGGKRRKRLLQNVLLRKQEGRQLEKLKGRIGSNIMRNRRFQIPAWRLYLPFGTVGIGQSDRTGCLSARKCEQLPFLGDLAP